MSTPSATVAASNNLGASTSGPLASMTNQIPLQDRKNKAQIEYEAKLERVTKIEAELETEICRYKKTRETLADERRRLNEQREEIYRRDAQQNRRVYLQDARERSLKIREQELNLQAKEQDNDLLDRILTAFQARILSRQADRQPDLAQDGIAGLITAINKNTEAVTKATLVLKPEKDMRMVGGRIGQGLWVTSKWLGRNLVGLVSFSVVGTIFWAVDRGKITSVRFANDASRIDAPMGLVFATLLLVVLFHML